MKNVENMLRQAHDVLYDELNRNVREMTTDESNFIRDCLDKMDSWIKDAEGKFGRADASQSKKLVKSSGYLADPTDLAYEACEYFKGKKPSKIAVAHWLADKFGYERGKPTDTDFVDTLDSLMMEYPYAYDEYHKDTPDDEYVDFYDAEEEVLSGCHGKSDKRRREKKEDELESSSRKSVKSSPDMLLRNRAREIFRRFDDLSPDYQEDILIKFDVNDKDDLADYVMAYGNASAIDELDDAVAEAESKLYSSRNAKTFSKFNRISSLFIKNDVLKPGKTGIELDINGWKIINKEGKPTGGEAAEFNSEKAARDSEIFKKLVDRYGADKVRTFKQS
jgi:hypothetical protein